MKILKRILIAILIVIALIVIAVTVLYVLDTSRASYLKTKNMEVPFSEEFLIKNVNVIPMTKDTVLVNKMVHIKAGKIYNVDDTIKEQGLEIKDGLGKFLSPGLIDMHVHVWDRFELGLYLANGITTVRNLWGVPLHLRIKNEIANDELVGPMFYTSSPKLTGPDDHGDDKVQIQSVEQARELIQDYDKRGYDFIKTYAGITEPIFEAIVEEATSLDLDIVSHPSFHMTYSNNFIEQVATIEHAEDIVQQPLNYQLDSVKLDSLIGLMTASKVNFSPTLSGFYNIYRMLTEEDLLQKKSIGYINPLFKSVDTEVQVARWQGEKSRDPEVVERILTQHKFHLYIIKQLHEAGVNIVCSTDAGIAIGAPGYSIHQEMQHYSEAGLNNYEVIKTATVNPTRVHKEFENMGTIEKGKYANLILSDENPLQDLKTLKEPRWVIIKGRVLDEKTLNTYKKKAFNRNNLTSTALYWIENLWVER